MGFFSKLLFWRKKKEETSDYEDINKEETMPEQQQPQISPRLDYGSGYMQPQPTPMQQPSEDREFKILSDKLDIINSKLEIINQRLSNLEQRKPKEIVQRW